MKVASNVTAIEDAAVDLVAYLSAIESSQSKISRESVSGN